MVFYSKVFYFRSFYIILNHLHNFTFYIMNVIVMHYAETIGVLVLTNFISLKIFHYIPTDHWNFIKWMMILAFKRKTDIEACISYQNIKTAFDCNFQGYWYLKSDVLC